MKKLTVFVLLLILTSLAPSAWAASPWTEKTTWGDKAVAKLDFGFKNFFGGVSELWMEPREVWSDKSQLPAAFGRGIAYSLADIVGGALHILTFPITQLDVPLPENGVQL